MNIMVSEFIFLLAIMGGLAAGAVILLIDGHRLNREVRSLRLEAGELEEDLRLAGQTIARQRDNIVELLGMNRRRI